MYKISIIKSSIFILIAILITSCSEDVRYSPFEKDLSKLDYVIEHADEYVKIKEQKISTIKNMLNSRGVSHIQQYHIYQQLYFEYQAYQFDKALEMLNKQVSIAQTLANDSLKNSALIEKSTLLTTAGYYTEAERVFQQIDTTSFGKEQLVNWCISRQKYLYDYHEYVSSSGFQVPDYDKLQYYQSMIISLIDENSRIAKHIKVLFYMENNNLREAHDLNLSLLKSMDNTNRDYAVQAYFQGVIEERMGNIENAIHWWTESAICDIVGAIKDNASLTTISSKLMNPIDSDRAFKYIRFSLDDAAFYNAKLRRVQLATSLPAIEKAYANTQERQAKTSTILMCSLVVVALLLALACVAIFITFLKNRRTKVELEQKNRQLISNTQSIENAQESLRKINLELVEANAAKEEYLGLFLSMCSGYLDKLKKALPRDYYESELRIFYKTFDTSFLTLYPTFIEEFNMLLQEDSRIILKEGEILSTELRIFALIKLGITQSSHIASLLRYSVNTIYNYRAQIKNAALKDRENFEEMVKKIGSRQ